MALPSPYNSNTEERSSDLVVRIVNGVMIEMTPSEAAKLKAPRPRRRPPWIKSRR